MSVRVRSATADDAERIAEVQVRTWQAAYGHVFPQERLDELDETLERRTARLRRVVEEGAAHLLVAEIAGELVGFAWFGAAETEEGVGELYAIYVVHEAWGRGAGQALIGEVPRLLREDGFDEAILWVLEENPRTRRFYERCGWRADGATKEEEWLGVVVPEVRYRLAL